MIGLAGFIVCAVSISMTTLSVSAQVSTNNRCRVEYCTRSPTEIKYYQDRAAKALPWNIWDDKVNKNAQLVWQFCKTLHSASITAAAVTDSSGQPGQRPPCISTIIPNPGYLISFTATGCRACSDYVPNTQENEHAAYLTNTVDEKSWTTTHSYPRDSVSQSVIVKIA